VQFVQKTSRKYDAIYNNLQTEQLQQLPKAGGFLPCFFIVYLAFNKIKCLSIIKINDQKKKMLVTVGYVCIGSG